jgi:hypothetical protein
MWIVSNQLKGVLKFPALAIEVTPDGEFDLDTLGREKAEASSEIKIALDNAYLKTVRKTIMIQESELQEMIERRIAEIKKNLVTEISDLYAPPTRS